MTSLPFLFSVPPPLMSQDMMVGDNDWNPVCFLKTFVINPMTWILCHACSPIFGGWMKCEWRSFQFEPMRQSQLWSDDTLAPFICCCDWRGGDVVSFLTGLLCWSDLNKFETFSEAKCPLLYNIPVGTSQFYHIAHSKMSLCFLFFISRFCTYNSTLCLSLI